MKRICLYAVLNTLSISNIFSSNYIFNKNKNQLIIFNSYNLRNKYLKNKISIHRLFKKNKIKHQIKYSFNSYLSNYYNICYFYYNLTEEDLILLDGLMTIF